MSWFYLHSWTADERSTLQDEVQVVTQLVVEHHQLVLEITLIQAEQQDAAHMPKARALPQGRPELSGHQLLIFDRPRKWSGGPYL